jgi:hypothetical protein
LETGNAEFSCRCLNSGLLTLGFDGSGDHWHLPRQRGCPACQIGGLTSLSIHNRGP